MSLFSRFARRFANTSRRRAAARRRALHSRAPAAEVLEDRTLLSNIVWENRGDASDGFDQWFQEDAELARNVVDAAIEDWEEVIVDFNYANDPGTNDLTMTIFMDPTLGNALGLSTAVVLDSVDDDGKQIGKPISGTLKLGVLDSDGDGRSDGWFVDPTPNDHSEFLGLQDANGDGALPASPNITNAFMLEATPGGDAAGLNDLYSLVIHEMGHAVGFTSTPGSAFQTSGLFTDTGFPDTSSTANGSTATFYAFEGPSVNALLTSANLGKDAGTAIHTAGEIANNDAITFDSMNFYGTREIMNRNAATFEKRALISNKVALMLQDVGYSIDLPEFHAHAYALLNETTGHLTIRGGRDDVVINNIFQMGPSDDTVIIDRFGDSLMVSVDVGVDVPGTGAGQDPFDQSNAFITFFDVSQVSSISIDTYGGDDTIAIRGLAEGMNVVINAGDDDDSIIIGQGMLDEVESTVTTFGDAGNDTIRFNDSSNAASVDHSLVGLTYTHSAAGSFAHDATMENIVIDGGSGSETYAIAGTGSDNVTVNAGGGGDAITIGDGDLNVFGDVTINGGSQGAGEGDSLIVDDSLNTGPETFTLESDTVSRTGVFETTFSGIETLDVRGGTAANTFDINETANGVDVAVTGGNSGDTFNVGIASLNLIDGLLTIDGADGTDEDVVTFHDPLGSSLVYVIQNDVVSGNQFAAITLENIEQATLDANPLNNVVHIDNSYFGTQYTVNGYSGNDWFYLATSTHNLNNFNSPVVVNGGFGENHLVLYDDSTPFNFDYTVTGNSIDRLLFGEFNAFPPQEIGVTFSDMADVELFLNEDGNTVNVQSTNPDTQYIFHGNDGSDTLNLNRDLDSAVDPFVDIDGAAVTSAAMDIDHDDFEQLNLNLGDELNTVRVHSLQSPAAINLGLGDDRLFVTPNSANLSAIHFPITVDGQGGVDRVHLLDQNFSGTAPFTVTKNSVDRFLFGPLIKPGLTYFDVDFVRLFMGSGDNVVNINTTATGAEYLFAGGLGDDTFNLNLLPIPQVTLFGGVGDDHANITGTDADEEVSISAGFGGADINLPGIETATFDGLGGIDALSVEGVVGINEQIELEASTTAGAGDLRITGTTMRDSSTLDLVFENTEIFDLIANASDDDTAAFIGTDQDDDFEIDLGAAGTNADPVLQLFASGGASPLLTVRDYSNFGTLEVRGEDGVDTFNVFVAPTGPGAGRNLSIDGGDPSGQGSGKDELTVFFESPNPDIDHEHDNQTNTGSFDVDYGSLHSFFIEYSNIEKALSKSANSNN